MSLDTAIKLEEIIKKAIEDLRIRENVTITITDNKDIEINES